MYCTPSPFLLTPQPCSPIFNSASSDTPPQLNPRCPRGQRPPAPPLQIPPGTSSPILTLLELYPPQPLLHIRLTMSFSSTISNSEPSLAAFQTAFFFPEFCLMLGWPPLTEFPTNPALESFPRSTSEAGSTWMWEVGLRRIEFKQGQDR